MAEATPKRGRGRPKGSGKASSASKVVKNHAPPRRSTRGTQASRSQADMEVQATEDEADNHLSPAADASSENGGAWEIERQIILDGSQDLRNRCEELEAALARTLEESAAELQEATDVINANERKIEELQESLDFSEDHIDRLRLDKMALLRRAKEAEEREAELKNHINILQSGQPGPSTGPSPRRHEPVLDEAPSSGRDGAAAPGPSQVSSGATRLASGATAAPRERAERNGRTAWSADDEDLFVGLIAHVGPSNKRPQWSKLARIWNEKYRNRTPRDQGQLKDKAWNYKEYILMNRLTLPPKFNYVGLKDKARQKIIAAGLNPDRREEDVDESLTPINVWLAR